MHEIEIGALLPSAVEQENTAPSTLVRAARHAEQAGLDTVSLSDVLVGDGSPVLEAITAAAAAAAVTSRMRIEFGVLALPTRNVAMLAAQLGTLQHLAAGRLVLGVGIGGFPASPFAKAAHAPRRGRGETTDRMLRELPALLRGEPVVLDGSAEPVSLGRLGPVPPIVVGGDSDASIRRAVNLADGWFPSLATPEKLAERIAVLTEQAAAAGRARPRVHYGTHAALGPDGAAKHAEFIDWMASGLGLPAETAERAVLSGGPIRVAERLGEFAEAGAQSVTVSLDGGDYLAQLDILAEARRQLTG